MKKFNWDMIGAFATLGAVIVLVGSCGKPSYGDDCHKKVVVQQEQVINTAFAVPVAVPVAPYASYFYGAGPQQVQAYQAPPPDPLDELARKIASRLSLRTNAAAPP